MATWLWTVPVQAEESPRSGSFDLTISVDIATGSDDITARFYDGIESLSWDLYVPENYNEENPPGIIVFISPLKSGKVPKPWKPVLDQFNMIYISANGAGNKVPAFRRMMNALLAINIVRSRYKTDQSVTIISGFSGGARTSCLVLESFPGVFNGAMVMGGAFDWKGDLLSLAKTLEDGAYFFMAGNKDHAAAETKRTFRQYSHAGLITQFRSIRNKGHTYPGRRDFRAALKFLTSNLRELK